MHRFYIAPQNIDKGLIQLSAEEAKHAFSVLRFKKNDKINVFDGVGNSYIGLIKSLNRKSGVILIQKRRIAPKSKYEIVLASAIPKHSKFEDIIDVATQIGVQEIIPLFTQRTIVKISAEKQKLKQDRWQKIAINSAKQAQVEYTPQITLPTDFSSAINKADSFDIALILSLQKNNLPLKKILQPQNGKKKKSCKSIIIFIGPEGDFTDQEITQAKKKGCIGVSLGENVLRCQTAASKILSIINYEWKE
ncbi:MAG: RsmE family RNA methyltransferase [Candidatus Omnitrophota bacterium]